MKAIIDTIEGLQFTCPICGSELVLEDTNITLLMHPDRSGGWNGNKYPINCEHAGKRFKRPTIELEAV